MARPSSPSKVARRQARAEVQPQIRSARQEARGQRRSINSSVPAIEEGLEDAERAAKHSGLSRHDAQILLSQFANQQADAAASAALQDQQVNQSTGETIKGLHQTEGEQTRSILSQLQTAATEHAQKVADERRGNQEGVSDAIQEAELEKKLGLGDYATTPLEKAEIEKYGREAHNGGLTPTEARDQAESASNAHSYAANLVKAVHAAGGKTEVDGQMKQILPAHPRDYTDANWAALTEEVAKHKGVDSYAAAEKAINAIRSHFQPGQGPPTTVAQAGAKAVGQSLGHAASSPLSPILQFGAQLLTHG